MVRRSISDSSVYLADVATGNKELLTPEKASYLAGSFTPDGRGLYLASDLGSEFLRLAYMDLTTRKIAFLRPGAKWDVVDFALSADGRSLFTRSALRESDVWMLDFGGGR